MMKMTGMQWQKYDMLVRQKRGKKIARGSKKVGSRVTTDDILLGVSTTQASH